jgi:hypothetical protein
MDGNTSDALVFIPPLAKLLADAETVKRSPLTESEVARITDAAYCVRMPTAEAIEIAELRGYHDVEPEVSQAASATDDRVGSNWPTRPKVGTAGSLSFALSSSIL